MARKKETSTSHTLQFAGQTPNPERDTFVYDASGDPPGVVTHGGTFEATDEQFEAFMNNEHTITLLKEVDQDYSQSSRSELEQQARDAGIENPEDHEAYPTDGTLALAIAATKDEGEEPEAEAEVAEPEQTPEEEEDK